MLIMESLGFVPSSGSSALSIQFSVRKQYQEVMMNLDNYESMKETAYLMSSETNHRKLSESIRELDAGGGHPHELIATEDRE